ncbi:hypothetical protein QNL22_16165 [Pseudomonas syringae pv. tomato]|nr:hypothetical protein [Pseudomonas syringae group genomosp. 3]MDT3236661.1 hypothetical protein [Pseudomonas syringae pv. tomato]
MSRGSDNLHGPGHFVVAAVVDLKNLHQAGLVSHPVMRCVQFVEVKSVEFFLGHRQFGSAGAVQTGNFAGAIDTEGFAGAQAQDMGTGIVLRQL